MNSVTNHILLPHNTEGRRNVPALGRDVRWGGRDAVEFSAVYLSLHTDETGWNGLAELDIGRTLSAPPLPPLKLSITNVVVSY